MFRYPFRYPVGVALFLYLFPIQFLLAQPLPVQWATPVPLPDTVAASTDQLLDGGSGRLGSTDGTPAELYVIRLTDQATGRMSSRRVVRR